MIKIAILVCLAALTAAEADADAFNGGGYPFNPAGSKAAGYGYPSNQGNFNSAHAGLTPTIAKALSSYIAETREFDDCGEMTKVYIQSILSGSSAAAAAQSAAKLYINNHRSARPRGLSPACQAAEAAYKAAYYAGLEPIFPAAKAYMVASGSSSPCKAAASEYIKAFSEGREAGAFLEASKAFFSQFAVQPSIDPACTKAALAATSGSSSPASAAARAFIGKSMEIGSNGNDPLCSAAAERFINSYMSGVDEEKNLQEAAKTFISLFSNNPTNRDAVMNSPCAAASQAYIQAMASTWRQ